MIHSSVVTRATHCLVAALLAGLSAGAHVAPQEPRASQTRHWTPSRDYDVRHYAIEVALDWATRTVSGRTTVTARPFRDGLAALVLDAEDMTVTGVTLPGGARLPFVVEAARLRITLDRSYRAGEELSVTVAHHGSPLQGLRFIDGPTPEVRQIWTVGQTDRNHHWFPCYDAPNDLATVDMTVTVPQPYRAIGNGVLASVAHDPARHVSTYAWKMAQPIASYLVSLAVGDFAEIVHADSPAVRSYVPKARLAEARRSLAETPDMLRFFADYFGVAYPYATYKQTLVREFPGGMENASATTLGESVISDARAALDEAEGARLLMAHEVAHQWFGNMVTCRDWSEIWLSEGAATYFAHVYADRPGGDEELRYGMLQAQGRSLSAWTGGNTRPLLTNRYDSAEDLFDVHAYATGAVVLDMLRFVLGDEPFRQALRQYLQTNAFANAGTHDLGRAIERSTGQAVDWFFDQWVSNTGIPEWEASYVHDAARRAVVVRVRQNGRVFRMPVEIGVTTAGGEQTRRVWIDRSEQEFSFDVDTAPLIVNVDRGSHVLKRLRFDKSVAELAYQARHDADASGRIRAARALAGANTPDAAAALADMLTGDPFWGARVEAARALAGRHDAAVRTAALTGLSDRRSAVRRESAKLLAGFREADVEEALLAAVARDESYYVVREAARALVGNGSPKAASLVAQLLDTPSDKDLLRVAALDLLGVLRDPAALPLVRRHAGPDAPSGVRAAALRTLGTLGAAGASDRPSIVAALAAALTSGPEAVKLAAVDGLERLPDPAAIPALRAAAETPAVSGPNDALLRRRIRDLLRKLETVDRQER